MTNWQQNRQVSKGFFQQNFMRQNVMPKNLIFKYLQLGKNNEYL